MWSTAVRITNTKRHIISMHQTLLFLIPHYSIIWDMYEKGQEIGMVRCDAEFSQFY
jgi:hypothetical protein